MSHKSPLLIANQRNMRILGLTVTGDGASEACCFYGDCEDIVMLGTRFAASSPLGTGLRVSGTLRGLTMAGVRVEPGTFYTPPDFISGGESVVERLAIIGLDPEYARGDLIYLASSGVSLGDGSATLGSGQTVVIGDRGQSDISAREPFISAARAVSGRITHWRAVCSRGPGGGETVTFRLRVDGVTVSTLSVIGTGMPASVSEDVSVGYSAGAVITCEVESTPGALALGVGADVSLYEG